MELRNIILAVCMFHRTLKLLGISCGLYFMSIDGDNDSDLFAVSVLHVCGAYLLSWGKESWLYVIRRSLLK
jgi:hypothetical protein